jgi:transposase
MTATHSLDSIRSARPLLYLSFERSSSQWKVASTNARGQKPRLVSAPAGDRDQVLREIARAKKRFDLPRNATAVSCYEAGRDGFWLHRFLHHFGVNNLVVDSSSIEVNRRLRRAKADNLDAVSLVGMLIRYCDQRRRRRQKARRMQPKPKKLAPEQSGTRQTPTSRVQKCSEFHKSYQQLY